METTMSTQLTAAHPALSWRAVLAGLALSLFCFITLLTLGLAVGGFSLSDGVSLRTTGAYGAIWIGIACAISLFVGSYFSSRITPYISNKVGLGQGAVLSAIFFGIVLWQSAAIVGSISGAASSLIGNAASATASAAQGIAREAMSAQNGNLSGMASIMTEDALSGLELRTDAGTIGAGIARRLLSGNVEGAKTYLANQSNLTEEGIEMRIETLNDQMQAALIQARDQSARAMQIAGLSLFITLVVGFVASAFGGQLGIRANRIHPLVAAPAQTSARFEPVFT